MNLLAADIGATNSRLAWVSGEEVRVGHYRNADFSDLYQVIARFLQDHSVAGARIARMVLALPGPPDPGRVALTNIDWLVERGRLLERFAVDEVLLLNDFQAAAVGALYSEERVGLNPSAPCAERGTAVVTGAGTGLGMAWCPDIAACELPLATEGGHVDFAPVDETQYRLHAWLARRYGHVSCERVLSGQGLRDMYSHFGGNGEEAPQAAEIEAGARAGDQTCERVIRCFVSVLGQYAGNLALQFNPPAGVHLCGGVVAHLSPWIEEGFMTHYLDKGRMRAQVGKIPVYLVKARDIGLMGAIRIARGR